MVAEEDDVPREELSSRPSRTWLRLPLVYAPRSPHMLHQITGRLRLGGLHDARDSRLPTDPGIRTERLRLNHHGL